MQVLLLGGHGKVALYLTPLLLNRAWNVTSVVRNPDHETEILALGKGRKGNVNVLISSLADVKSAGDAQQILNSVKPDYVVWSAGMLPLTLPASALPGQRLITHQSYIHLPFYILF
jgi:dTDP-4-dehydrorhamnose reductase